MCKGSVYCQHGLGITSAPEITFVAAIFITTNELEKEVLHHLHKRIARVYGYAVGVRNISLHRLEFSFPM